MVTRPGIWSLGRIRRDEQPSRSRAAQAAGGGASGNYVDAETGEEYWISGVTRDGQDRRRSSRAPITIEAVAVEEYLALIGASALPSWLVVSNDIVETDIGRFHAMENEEL